MVGVLIDCLCLLGSVKCIALSILVVACLIKAIIKRGNRRG